MARKAKAWDSIKSPFIFNLSIRLKLILDGKVVFTELQKEWVYYKEEYTTLLLSSAGRVPLLSCVI